VNPVELVDAARTVSEIPDRTLGASRYLAAVFLLRQALEDALDRYWEAIEPGLEDCAGRIQMVSLPAYLDDESAARDVVYCWNRLSSASHHDAYELPPSQQEFDHYLAVTRRSVACLRVSPAD